jgi:hypothetical protein
MDIDIDQLFDRVSVAEIHQATGINAGTLRRLRDNRTKRLHKDTAARLAAWLKVPLEAVNRAVRLRGQGATE